MWYIPAIAIATLTMATIVVMRHKQSIKQLSGNGIPVGPRYLPVTDILETGTLARATVVSAFPYGLTAPNGDPVMFFTLHVIPPDDVPFQALITQRVPPEKISLTTPGAQLVVAFDPVNPTRRVGIDWDAVHFPHERATAPEPAAPEAPTTPIN